MPLDLDKKTFKISRLYSFAIPFCSVITFYLQADLDPHRLDKSTLYYTAENVLVGPRGKKT